MYKKAEDVKTTSVPFRSPERILRLRRACKKSGLCYGDTIDLALKLYLSQPDKGESES